MPAASHALGGAFQVLRASMATAPRAATAQLRTSPQLRSLQARADEVAETGDPVEAARLLYRLGRFDAADVVLMCAVKGYAALCSRHADMLQVEELLEHVLDAGEIRSVEQGFPPSGIRQSNGKLPRVPRKLWLALDALTATRFRAFEDGQGQRQPLPVGYLNPLFESLQAKASFLDARTDVPVVMSLCERIEQIRIMSGAVEAADRWYPSTPTGLAIRVLQRRIKIAQAKQLMGHFSVEDKVVFFALAGYPEDARVALQSAGDDGDPEAILDIVQHPAVARLWKDERPGGAWAAYFRSRQIEPSQLRTIRFDADEFMGKLRAKFFDACK
jgi:hypothetical protein